jgi:hypothetical protein
LTLNSQHLFLQSLLSMYVCPFFTVIVGARGLANVV